MLDFSTEVILKPYESDFLLNTSYRIEDEEWDKYIIPTKVESEKYKVSRTFSFLKSRMSNNRSKTKVIWCRATPFQRENKIPPFVNFPGMHLKCD